MKTLTINIDIYKYEDLTDKAKEKAREWWKELVTTEEWSSSVYEDASNVGIKIVGFDIQRGDYCAFDDSFNADITAIAYKIKENHGEQCDTHKLAESYIKDKESILEGAEKDENGEFTDENAVDEKLQTNDNTFQSSLQSEYLSMLRKEYEHYFSDENVSENIQCNEYDFLENGKRSSYDVVEEDRSDEEKAVFEEPEKCPFCAHELDFFDPEINADDKQSIKHDRDCQGCGATFCLTFTLSAVDVEEPTWNEEYQSTESVFEGYLECFFEGDKHKLKEAYASDECAIDEGWSNYTDSLCKDNKISDKQYHEMPSIDEMF